jgi:uncharacterized protein
VGNHVELARSDGTIVCRANVAKSFHARFRGLMLTPSLARGTGLLFPRTSSVHTHFMRYPLDVVFLDADRGIVSIKERVRPWRFAAARSAEATLELAAGECARLGLTVGETLSEV